MLSNQVSSMLLTNHPLEYNHNNSQFKMKIHICLNMNKYQAFDKRVGIFGKQGEEHKSRQYVSKSGVRCITFWDTLRNRYTTATNYILNIIGEVENE